MAENKIIKEKGKLKRNTDISFFDQYSKTFKSKINQFVNSLCLTGPWKHTRQIDGKQPRFIPMTKIGIARREKTNEKIDFRTLTFLKYKIF